MTGHARHDPLRVAEAVDRGGRLAPVLRFCDQCGQLYADLVALTGALPLAAFPARPRDYMLGSSDAEQLGSDGWRTWWSAIGSARDRVTRPLAFGFTTLGLAGLLLTGAPSFVPSLGSAAAPDHDHVRIWAASGSAPIIDPSPAPEGAAGGPTAADQSRTPIVSAGLIVAGGGLFVARRIAGHRRLVR